MKNRIKKRLVALGLRHPAKGVKVSAARKEHILLGYKRPGMTQFVETGTNQGDMLDAVRGHFDDIYSVELDNAKYAAAVERFHDDSRVHLYHGDSGQQMRHILTHIHSPTLFWIDAHGSPFNLDNSPVREELHAIFNHRVQNHVILIDDARHFTLGDLREIEATARYHGYRYSLQEGLLVLV